MGIEFSNFWVKCITSGKHLSNALNKKYCPLQWNKVVLFDAKKIVTLKSDLEYIPCNSAQGEVRKLSRLDFELAK